jgi:AbiV family abortive infection protein
LGIIIIKQDYHTLMTAKNLELELTEKEIMDICDRCYENVRCLLKSAKLLVGQDSKQYALGFYMYAVEEFGKAQLLKVHTLSHIIPKWIFGRKPFLPTSPHDAKLAEGFKYLPEECQILCVGLRFVNNNNEKTQTYSLGRKLKVSVPAFTTGFVSDVTRGSILEFDFKTACFYIDWDNDNRHPTFKIEVDTKRLDKNIRLFEKVLENFV